jgi:hypothetical protein
MSNFYAKNLAYLPRHNPLLPEKLNKIKSVPLNLPPFREKYKLLRSEIKDINIIIVLGFGKGEHIRELLEVTAPYTFILVIESKLEYFKWALEEFELSYILSHPRVSIAVGEEPGYAVRNYIDAHFRVNFSPRITAIEYKEVTSKDVAYYTAVKRYIEEIVEVARSNLATLKESGEVWQTHLLENINFIISCPGINKLASCFKDIPGIVVAAGPSLDKNVEYLKGVKDNALIIVVDTALRTLLNNGINPNLITSLDAWEINYRLYLKDLKPQGSFLVTTPAAYPQLFQDFSERTFLCGFPHPFMQLIELYIGKLGELRIGGSVATATFDLLRLCKCNPIIFVGLDLSYPEGKVYTQHVPKEWQEEVKKNIENTNLIWVEDVYGGKVQTTSSMYLWIKWFEHQVNSARKENTVCIDATEGGAKIEGTEIMKLKDVIANFPHRNLGITQTLANILSSHSINLRIKNELANKLFAIGEYWLSPLGIAKKGSELIDKLANGYKFDEKIWKELHLLYEKIISDKTIISLGKWGLEPLLYILEEKKFLSQKPPFKERVDTLRLFFSELYRYLSLTRTQILKAAKSIQI